jgi:cobalt/nickel transport system permease protein
MHLGADAITPECAVITFGAAAAGLGWGIVEARRTPAIPQRMALAATLGAFVMAAQAWNVPVLSGTSGHLVGGVLLAWAIGPGLAIWSMASVLLLQAVLLGDGGLMAWGANTLNMGVVPAFCLVAARRVMPKESESSRELIVVSFAAAASVVLAAALLCGEVALGRAASELPIAAFCQQMLGLHLVIGGLEAAFTLPLAALLLPIVRGKQAFAVPRLVTLALAAALLVPVSLWASSQLPDGYESAAETAGWTSLLGESAALVTGLDRTLGLCLAILLTSVVAAGIAWLSQSKLARQRIAS